MQTNRFELLYFMKVMEQKGIVNLKLADFKEYFSKEGDTLKTLLHHTHRDGYIFKNGTRKKYRYSLTLKGQEEVANCIKELVGEELTPLILLGTFGD